MATVLELIVVNSEHHIMSGRLANFGISACAQHVHWSYAHARKRHCSHVTHRHMTRSNWE
jgi:hypothetical protein